jgi:hypothetical protein
MNLHFRPQVPASVLILDDRRSNSIDTRAGLLSALVWGLALLGV